MVPPDKNLDQSTSSGLSEPMILAISSAREELEYFEMSIPLLAKIGPSFSRIVLKSRLRSPRLKEPESLSNKPESRSEKMEVRPDADAVTVSGTSSSMNARTIAKNLLFLIFFPFFCVNYLYNTTIFANCQLPNLTEKTNKFD